MASVALQPRTAGSITDHSITTAINRLLAARPHNASHLPTVLTREGVVTLRGSVPNLLVYEWVEEATKTIYGVRAVINELTVHTPVVPDSVLRSDVTQALADDPASRDLSLTCLAQNGIVKVRGQVRTWAEKQLALRVIRGVRGIRAITDQVAYGLEASHYTDERQAAHLRYLLAWDVRANTERVRIAVFGGIITLTGSVGTAAEHRHVVNVAWSTGAFAVNDLDLLIDLHDDNTLRRQLKYVARPDSSITQAVYDTFLYDPRVFSFEPTVRVKSGIVTLSGTVSNVLARQAAEQDARNVVGVWGVHNYLLVRSPQMLSDGSLHDRIKAALARDAIVGHHQFTVNVQTGKVTLYGTVVGYDEQQRAGELAAGMPGVTEVVNRIGLAGQSAPDCEPAPEKHPVFLILTDFFRPSNQALAYATTLADAVGARLVLLHIVRSSLDPDRFIRQIGDVSRESLDQAFAAIVRSLPVPAVAEVEHGRVTSSVADAVRRLAPTLIVLGRPDAEDIPDELATTTALDLLRAVPYPMLVVPPGAGGNRAPRRVLVSADDEPFTLGAYAATTRHLLHQLGAEATVIHVTSAANGAVAEAEALGRTHEAVRRAGLLTDQPNLQIRHEIAVTPDEGILRAARSGEFDLVAIIARPRSFFSRLFHHSVTAHVLLHCPLPVLVLPAQN